MTVPVPHAPKPLPRPLRILRLCLAVIGVSMLAIVAVDRTQVVIDLFAMKSANADRRASALDRIADRRDRRAYDAVLTALENETDRALLEKAGYAAMRLGDARALPALCRRAETGPDDWVRAKLIVYAARLAARDTRWLAFAEAAARSNEPWRQAGGALALAELGRPEGGRQVAELIPPAPEAIRAFTLKEFRRRIGEPMMQAAGEPLDWQGLETAPPNDPRWAKVQAFWAGRASPRLLHDVLIRQDRRDPDWHLVNRLLHAREYAEKLLF